MNSIRFYLVVFACFAIMSVVIYALIRDKKNLKKEIKELKNEIDVAREKTKELLDYISNSGRVHKEEKEIAQKIKDAKTDEEVHSIINDIISLNNARVQNSKD